MIRYTWIIDLCHSAAMMSLRRIKSFVYARQASPSKRREFSARLAVRKQSLLFYCDSTWLPSDKDLLLKRKEHLIELKGQLKYLTKNFFFNLKRAVGGKYEMISPEENKLELVFSNFTKIHRRNLKRNCQLFKLQSISIPVICRQK